VPGSHVLRADAGAVSITGGDASLERSWSEMAPADGVAQARWADFWARKRADAKGARDFAEADRIRALLAEHGWEVRDVRGGESTVKRRL
ncbi:MAG: hypothetical protein ACRDLF_15735, partial [Solirubrobacteraceae bacterium]